MDVVVVESPAKAKTINKYLGPNYRVVASYGHVRDLPSRDGSVRPDQDFAMDWEVDAQSEKRLKEIAKAVAGAERLFLATDPDREGEAISWHVCQELAARRALEKVDVKRVVFHEITRDAVTEAMRHARGLDQELIEAYLARRALDYLVGFTLSPVLWRKLPGARSAGRVQSVALRLICDREAEIERFRAREYWTVEAALATEAGGRFTARLSQLDGAKLGQFDLPDEAAAKAAVARVEASALHVAAVERKRVARRPQPPFTTSTLQQEASRKLGFGAAHTMRVAQRLYEGVELGGETVGLITYMRTDSVQMAAEAVAAAREAIGRQYGAAYLPAEPNSYRARAKNAQEAHEAIRPTDLHRRPEDVARYLDEDGRRLYGLIWTRAVASQMADAALEQIGVDIASADGTVVLRASGTVVLFDGFLRLYQEGRDDAGEEGGEEAVLPNLAEGERLSRGAVTPIQHFTKPPPRFTEASLVKRLEELGIGRPSTYAQILTVLQDRNYVHFEQRRFVPNARGRIVTAFLESFFERYVEYDFTADLEDKLDEVSNGRADWKTLLRQFWDQFSKAVEETKGLRISEVLDALDEELGPHFFPDTGEGSDPRLCPACGAGRLGLRLGKHGAFIGCSNYPDCAYTRPLAVGGEGEPAAAAGPRSLGFDPETGEEITLRKGPFGFYVQRGEAAGKEKPKRASLLRGMDPDAVDLDTALRLLSLPRELGPHPADGQPILAGVGRYGPYLKHGASYTSLKGDDDVLTIGLNRAVAVLAEAPRARRGGAEPLRTLGEHPADGKAVALFKGRYGPYVKHGATIASLPKSVSPDTVTLEEALPLLAARAQKGGRKQPARKGSAKADAKTSARGKTRASSSG